MAVIVVVPAIVLSRGSVEGSGIVPRSEYKETARRWDNYDEGVGGGRGGSHGHGGRSGMGGSYCTIMDPGLLWPLLSSM